ncbi:MAG: hypothetical protein V7609_1710 [Verrucomicrobiota bacterium]
MTERDWVCELEGYLQNRFAGLCKTISPRLPPSLLRVIPPLGAEEAKYFLLGVENGLFQLDDEGYVASDLFPAPNSSASDQRMCQIFWYNSLPPRLFRESICQLSTASALILKRGWLRSHVLIEPSIDEQSFVTSGVDILVKSPGDGRTLIGVEVKRNAAELRKLVLDLQACSRRGPHTDDDCGFPQNHPKYEFCVLSRPSYFWAVAPDAEVCFRMNYENGIALEQLASLPPRSLIEFS